MIRPIDVRLACTRITQAQWILSFFILLTIAFGIATQMRPLLMLPESVGPVFASLLAAGGLLLLLLLRGLKRDTLLHAEKTCTQDAWLRLAVQSSQLGWWHIRLDPAGENPVDGETFLSPELKKFIGFNDDEFPSDVAAWHARIPEEDRKRLVQFAADFAAGKIPRYDVTYRIRHRNGSIVWIRSLGDVERDDRGRITAWCGVDLDQTEMRRNQKAAETAANIVNHMSDAVMIMDRDRRITFVNRAFTKLTGYAMEEMLGEMPLPIRSDRHDASFYDKLYRSMDEAGSWIGEMINRRKDGSLFTSQVHAYRVPAADGDGWQYVANISDISELVESRERLEFLSQCDQLTGLANINLLKSRLEQLGDDGLSEGEEAALLVIDIDNFQAVNAAFGIVTGDTVLQEIAARLAAHSRFNEMVVRLSGDSFALLLCRRGLRRDIVHISDNLARTIRQPVDVDGETILLDVCIGISLMPEPGFTFADMLHNADTALHTARERGAGHHQLYSTEISERLGEELRMASALRLALKRNDEIYMQVQPIVDLASGRWVHAEVLARWNHPEWGMIPPDKFIGVAERNGIISDIGDYMLRLACRQLAKWRTAGSVSDDFRLAVNLSVEQLDDPNIHSRVLDIVYESGVPPGNIMLELTESALMTDPLHSAFILTKFREAGFHLAVDDFGTGYSSLAYLSRFDIDELKIDRSFIDHIDISEHDAQLVRAILHLATSLKLKVVAEGVETEKIAALLTEWGCSHAQGYHFGRPMAAKDFLAAHQAKGVGKYRE